MKTFIISVVAFLSVVAWSVRQSLQSMIDNHTRYQQSVYAIKLEQRRLQAAQAATYDAATLPITIIVTWALWALLIVALVLVVWGVLDYYRARKHVIMYAGLPVARAELLAHPEHTRRTIEGVHQTRMLQAANSYAVPHTYSPKISSERMPYMPQLTDDMPHTNEITPAYMPPDFSTLLDSGVIRTTGDMLMGYEEHEPRYGDWGDLYSLAIAGLQGSGKTTTTLFLLAQAAIRGAKLIICDPHGNATGNAAHDTLRHNVEPLRFAFLCDVAVTPDAIISAVRMANDVLTARIDGTPNTYPVLLVIDEFSTLVREYPALETACSRTLENIATQGRKFGVYAMLLGQQWYVNRSGGGALRSTLNAMYVHRIKPDVARQLTGYTRQEMPDTLHLQTGEAYLCDVRGNVARIRIPQTTVADLQRIAAYAPKHETIIDMPPVCREYAETGAAYTASQSDKTPNADAVRFARMFLDGMEPSAIVLQEYQVRSNGGGKYQQKLAYVLDMIRAGVRS